MRGVWNVEPVDMVVPTIILNGKIPGEGSE